MIHIFTTVVVFLVLIIIVIIIFIEATVAELLRDRPVAIEILVPTSNFTSHLGGSFGLELVLSPLGLFSFFLREGSELLICVYHQVFQSAYILLKVAWLGRLVLIAHGRFLGLRN